MGLGVSPFNSLGSCSDIERESCRLQVAEHEAEKMARLIQPLRQWPKLQHRSCYYTLFNHILVPSLPQTASAKTIFHSPSCVALPPSYRSIHHRSRRPRLANALVPSDRQKGDTTDSDTEVKKSRNQKKREARRAFQWGVDLASFSTPKIKRILKYSSPRLSLPYRFFAITW